MKRKADNKKLGHLYVGERQVGSWVDTSRLIQFSCGCTVVFSTEPDVRAHCRRCGQRFLRDDGPEPGACCAKLRPKGPVHPAKAVVVGEAA